MLNGRRLTVTIALAWAMSLTTGCEAEKSRAEMLVRGPSSSVKDAEPVAGCGDSHVTVPPVVRPPLVAAHPTLTTMPLLAIGGDELSSLASDWVEGGKVRTVRPDSDESGQISVVQISSGDHTDFSFVRGSLPLMLEVTAYREVPARLSELTSSDAFSCPVVPEGAGPTTTYRIRPSKIVSLMVIQGFFPTPTGTDVPQSASWVFKVVHL